MAGIFSNYSGLVNTAILPIYPNVGSLPATSIDGSCAITLDTHDLYIYNAGVPGWVSSGGPGGTVVAAIGTVGAPGFAFTGHLDTGMYWASNSLRWSVGGTLSMALTAGELDIYGTNIGYNQRATSATTTSMFNGVDNGALAILAGAGSGNAGGQIFMYGHTHATLADQIVFNSGGANVALMTPTTTTLHGILNVGTSLNMNIDNVAGAQNYVAPNSLNDGSMTVTGGSSTANGGQVVVYGSAHASLANKTRFNNSGNPSWQINAGGDLQNLVSANESTGSGTATIGAANCPAVTPSAIYKWLFIKLSDGSSVYIPCWK